MGYLRQIVITAATPRIAKASLRTALVVGLVLNTINQGAALLEGRPISVVQLLMNFVVPFCVSSYSAARNEISREKDEQRRLEDSKEKLGTNA